MRSRPPVEALLKHGQCSHSHCMRRCQKNERAACLLDHAATRFLAGAQGSDDKAAVSPPAVRSLGVNAVASRALKEETLQEELWRNRRNCRSHKGRHVASASMLQPSTTLSVADSPAGRR